MQPEFVILPIVGALIGWGTNALAIKMLFRPRRPLRIPGTSISFQGVLPRRQAELARSVSSVIEEELLPLENLIDRFDSPALRERIAAAVSDHVGTRIGTALPAFLPPKVAEALTKAAAQAAARESETLLDKMRASVSDFLDEGVSLGTLAEERLMDLDLERLEALVRQVSQRELRHIEYLGAVLGFLVGVVQVLSLSLLRAVLAL